MGSEGSDDLVGSDRRLLVVFKGSCPTCQLVLPLLEELYRRGEGRLDVVAVSQDSEVDTGAFVDKYGLTMPVYLDYPSWKLSASLGASSVPMLIDLRKGRFDSVIEGFDKAELGRLAKSLVEEQDLPWEPTSLFLDERLPDHKPG